MHNLHDYLREWIKYELRGPFRDATLIGHSLKLWHTLEDNLKDPLGTSLQNIDLNINLDL
jgi:hypothetical protein